MYTDRNFKTKKQLKEAVTAWNDYQALKTIPPIGALTMGAVLLEKYGSATPRPVTYHQPGPFGGNEPRDGEFSVEGPHYPEPHRWYARVTAKDGVIVKVK